MPKACVSRNARQVTDADVAKLLRMLTFVPLPEIEALEVRPVVVGGGMACTCTRVWGLLGF